MVLVRDNKRKSQQNHLKTAKMLCTGLKLPAAGAVGNLYLCMAACTVGLAITVATKMVSNWHANGSSKEDSMETKQAHRKVVPLTLRFSCPLDRCGNT
jgi:hypothetical protein